MYPGNFVNPKESLLLINRLKPSMDALNIVKSFIYYDIKSLIFAKKAASKKEKITEEIKDSKKINSELTGYWGLSLKPRYKQKPQFQGYNCVKCGEFKLVQWSGKFSNTKSTLKICFCTLNE